MFAVTWSNGIQEVLVFKAREFVKVYDFVLFISTFPETQNMLKVSKDGLTYIGYRTPKGMYIEIGNKLAGNVQGYRKT